MSRRVAEQVLRIVLVDLGIARNIIESTGLWHLKNNAPSIVGAGFPAPPPGS
jgi:hypothetical protein